MTAVLAAPLFHEGSGSEPTDTWLSGEEGEDRPKTHGPDPSETPSVHPSLPPRELHLPHLDRYVTSGRRAAGTPARP